MFKLSKHDLAELLRELAKSVEQSIEVDKFSLHTNHETVDIPDRFHSTKQVTGWTNITIHIRYNSKSKDEENS